VTLTPIDLNQPGQVYLILFGAGFDTASVASTAVTVQGVSVPVQYAGPQLSFAGLDQIGFCYRHLWPAAASTSFK
jgi:uncharacterized protein (TIGR03437 family)